MTLEYGRRSQWPYRSSNQWCQAKTVSIAQNQRNKLWWNVPVLGGLYRFTSKGKFAFPSPQNDRESPLSNPKIKLSSWQFVDVERLKFTRVMSHGDWNSCHMVTEIHKSHVMTHVTWLNPNSNITWNDENWIRYPDCWHKWFLNYTMSHLSTFSYRSSSYCHLYIGRKMNTHSSKTEEVKMRCQNMTVWSYRFTMTISFFSYIVQTVHVFIVLISTQILIWCRKEPIICSKGRLKIQIIPVGASQIRSGIRVIISRYFWKQFSCGKMWSKNSFIEFNV